VVLGLRLGSYKCSEGWDVVSWKVTISPLYPSHYYVVGSPINHLFFDPYFENWSKRDELQQPVIAKDGK
jgi:hypothetical protein